MRIISGYPCVRCGGTLATDPETYGVRVVCLQCGHDCHVTPLPSRGGQRAGQELPEDDSPRSAWVVHCPAADDCTECPLSRCRFDDARWWRAGRKAAFEALFAQLLTAGYAVESIVENTGFSERTVYRANRRHHNQMDYSDEGLAAFARIHDVPSVEALGPHLRLRPAPVKPKAGSASIARPASRAGAAPLSGVSRAGWSTLASGDATTPAGKSWKLGP